MATLNSQRVYYTVLWIPVMGWTLPQFIPDLVLADCANDAADSGGAHSAGQIAGFHLKHVLPLVRH